MVVLTNFIAGARDAVAVLALEKVLLAALAVGSVPVASAVEAVAAVACPGVQLLVEEAPVRESVAVASWSKGKKKTRVMI